MKNYNEEYYIFIHDSFSIKNNECLVELNRLMDVENSVVPFLTFGGNEYDNKNANTDGHQGELSLKNKEEKSIDVKGYEMYPASFNKFINALNKLFEIKIKILK